MKRVDIELDTGDTVFLMTDGLPELFNKDKESFGEERVKEIILHNAGEPVNEIVKKLFLAGEEWRKENKQNDDITLVAFRFKE